MEPSSYPPIVTEKEWRKARLEHLAKEKALTRELDKLHAERRSLPMVKVKKDYTFQTPSGQQTLLDLFGQNHTLIIYHFMFDPDWEKGCPGCTGYTNGISPDTISSATANNVGYIHVSRAPLQKLQAYEKEMGWTIPWVSSHESDFNYDFQATLDDAIKEPEYNYRSRDEVEAAHGTRPDFKGETPGLSVFVRKGNDIFHAYSTYERGVEPLLQSYALLEMTPWGRQEDWETSPAGWPQKPTYG